MKLTVLSFGIARDIVGNFELAVELSDGATVETLRQTLVARFPDFSRLASLRLAVNATYADDSQIINANDEIAIIPPVSGG